MRERIRQQWKGPSSALLTGQSASELQGSSVGKGHIHPRNILLRVHMF